MGKWCNALSRQGYFRLPEKQAMPVLSSVNATTCRSGQSKPLSSGSYESPFSITRCVRCEGSLPSPGLITAAPALRVGEMVIAGEDLPQQIPGQSRSLATCATQWRWLRTTGLCRTERALNTGGDGVRLPGQAPRTSLLRTHYSGPLARGQVVSDSQVPLVEYCIEQEDICRGCARFVCWQ